MHIVILNKTLKNPKRVDTHLYHVTGRTGRFSLHEIAGKYPFAKRIEVERKYRNERGKKHDIAPYDRSPVVKYVEIIRYDTTKAKNRDATNGQDDDKTHQNELIRESHFTLTIRPITSKRDTTVRLAYFSPNLFEPHVDDNIQSDDRNCWENHRKQDIEYGV
jgi:hypothetical protein